MKQNLNRIGVISLIIFFLFFYIITTFLLDRRKIEKNITPIKETENENINNHIDEINIVASLYKDARILYDVVNNKFKVSQDDNIVTGEIIYKKITNFHEVMDNVFTKKGIDKYIKDMGNYFAIFDEEYYLAGNLVNYQTYNFRGDETNIYITNKTNEKIDGIIYERWTSNNRNTLATIEVVKEDNNWLINNINILASE